MRKSYQVQIFALMVAMLPSGMPQVNAQANPNPDVIIVDASAPSHPFPHFWEKMFGSGRAVLSLRDSYRRDLREVKQATDFEYVRFHAIFHDEIGLYDEDSQGRPVYNFSYVDQIYDGLLASQVRPFVELSFMPQKLAAHNIPHSFWYKPNVSPPKDWAKWEDLISVFAKHLIDRYGIDEVAQWYFEVWNEPDLDFWAGDPRQATYWELYDHTARAIKGVNARLRVGGPATAQAAWADAFITHCSENNVPVDFVSTHVYGNDRAQDVFGTDENIPRNKMVCRAVSKVHKQIEASSMPHLPLIWSEFNASYMNEPDVTDSAYMGPWLADTIRQCDGLVSLMSYWTFSDVFEEQGVVKTPFYGGYGLIAAGGIPKPAYNAFKLLHRLGDQRIALDSESALFTRRDDGTLVLAVWNYAPPGEPGSPRAITLQLKNTKARHASISRVDHNHGDFHAIYEKMGSPRYPTEAQIEDLRRATDLPDPENRKLKNDELTITLPAHGLALIELK
ncbi:MAG TPA: glycosyl hydrolase [Terriglobales bacterium]|nr:glycosyl hydrolase [Terriglobales bacterium]